nr:uncharacterized protein LOC113825460 [Penaeus vannamei]
MTDDLEWYEVDRDLRSAVRKVLCYDPDADEVTSTLQQAVVALVGENICDISLGKLNALKLILEHRPTKETLYPTIYRRMDDLGLRDDQHTAYFFFKRALRLARNERWTLQREDVERVEAVLKLFEYYPRKPFEEESIEQAIRKLGDECDPGDYESLKEVLRYILKYQPKAKKRTVIDEILGQFVRRKETFRLVFPTTLAEASARRKLWLSKVREFVKQSNMAPDHHKHEVKM